MSSVGVKAIAAVALMSATAALSITTSSSALANVDEAAINGTFTATSNGEWAQTNDVYRDEATTRSVWKISTTCTTVYTCEGTVISDQNWTARIYTTNNLWYVKRDLEGWEPCPDGTSSPGQQIYRFWQASDDGYFDATSKNTLIGEDVTTGVSGGCGINRSLVVGMPFKLARIA